MRKSLRKFVLSFIFMMMCLTILSPAALAAENPSIEISATITLSGVSPALSENFPIQLSGDELTDPMPVGSVNGVASLIITGDGTVTFPKTTFTRVGTYKYTIRQQPGADPDCVYDDTIYHLTVFVTNATDGGLEITSVLNREGETQKSPQVLFNNRYASPAFVNLSAVTTLDGKAPQSGSFTFLLTDNFGAVLQTKLNQTGQIVFDELSFNKTGVYIFYIKEQIGNQKQIIFDTTVYKMIVAVTKHLNGYYEAAVSFEKAGTPFNETLIFANKTDTGELPYTGQAQSALPILGAILILGGVGLTFSRKKFS